MSRPGDPISQMLLSAEPIPDRTRCALLVPCITTNMIQKLFSQCVLYARIALEDSMNSQICGEAHKISRFVEKNCL